VPTVLILGGVNGAGKSSLARAMLKTPQFRDVPFLNADIFAARLRLERPELGLAAANFAGLRMVAEGHEQFLRERRSFISETVLANVSYRTLCDRAHAAGFRVELAYVAIADVEESLRRVRIRVAKGGHDVPEKDVRRRWALSHDNLAWFAQHADEVRVYDNSRFGMASRLIAMATDGQVTLQAGILPEIDRVLAPFATP
jgi:predicted ABC-type ATPase